MPTNNYYNHGSVPANNSAGASAEMRAEFDSVQAGFAKLATMTGNANRLIKNNSGGTAQAISSITDDGTNVDVAALLTATKFNGLTLASGTTGFSIGGGATSKTLNLSNSLTFAGVDGATLTFQGTDTYVGRATTDTLTNKSITSPTVTGTVAGTNATWNLGALSNSINNAAATGIGTVYSQEVVNTHAGTVGAWTGVIFRWIAGNVNTNQAYIGAQLTNATGNTSSDFVIGVKASNGASAITEYFRLAVGGLVSLLNGLSVTGTITGSSGILTTGPVDGIGYKTGAGGTVTQSTNRTTGVTLSKVCGQITTNNASLAPGAVALFTVTNTAVASFDYVYIHKQSGSNSGDTEVSIDSVAAGSFVVKIANRSTTVAETGAIVLNFSLYKGTVS